MSILTFIIHLFKTLFSAAHNIFPSDNQGVIPGQREEDYKAGTLPYSEVLPSGDWRPFCPDGERQSSRYADTQGCVSFSNNNAAEIQLKQQGISINFSDRFLAKMSGTTRVGNYQYTVEDTARKVGRVLESDYPTPEDFTWDSYYAPIPLEIQKKAAIFEEGYEWLPTDAASLKYHLKQAPIQITIPGDNPYHAVVLVAIENGLFYYFDSYAPYIKTMSTRPASAMKIIIKAKSMNPFAQLLNLDGTVGVFIKGDVPETLVAIAKTYGVAMPLKTDGTPDWDQFPKAQPVA